jgi:hypothetical protein
MEAMPNYQRGVCIYVDILGTRSNRVCEDKYRIHSIFHEEAAKSGSFGHDHTVFSRKVVSFSDCAYHFYFYKDNIPEHRKNDENLMCTALANVSISILRFYNSGFIVRGGACLDEYYLDGLGFFGPAIELAYKLEDKCAKMPRVIIENGMGRKVFDFERSNLDPAARFINQFDSYFVNEDDGTYSLNEFCHIERSAHLSLEENTIHLDSIVDSVKTLSAKQLDGCEDDGIRAKYNYLLNKVNEKVKVIKEQMISELEAGILLLPEIDADDIIRIIFSDREGLVYKYFSREELNGQIAKLINRH